MSSSTYSNSRGLYSLVIIATLLLQPILVLAQKGRGTIIIVPLMISEFRFRGPSTDGREGSRDEYVEIYNNSGAPFTINAADGSAGWSVAYLNSAGTIAAVAATIPNGTVIPAGGHYLLTNGPGSGPGYTLAPVAAGDLIYVSTDIPDDGAIGLFKTSNPANFSFGTRVDAVSLSSATGALSALFREGTNLPSPGPNDGQYAFVRKQTTGVPQDTNDNLQDFVFVSTQAGSFGGVQSQLGAPGPENSSSPVQRNALILASLIEPAAAASVSPNRVRNFTPVTNGGLGTLSIRRRFTNITGTSVTILRFRIIDVTTLNSPGYVPGGAQADVRVIDGSDISVSTTLGSLTVLGTTLQQPSPLQLIGGGGLNSTVTVAIPGGTLTPGATIDLHFLLGVQQSGAFKFYVNVEALP